MRRLGSIKEDSQNQDRWRGLTTGTLRTLPQSGKDGVVMNFNMF